MRGEGLRDGAGTAFLVGLDALEESHIRIRVVAGLVHILNAEEIRLALCIARKLQEGQGNRQVHTLVHGITCPGVGNENHRGDGKQLREFTLGGLAGAVARGDVRNLMGHHASQF